MKIKVKYVNDDSPRLVSFKKGDWIDLFADENCEVTGPYLSGKKVMFSNKLVSLGVSMKLPKGFEAVVNARSSTFSKFGFILWNSQGVIDGSYCGNRDIWKCPCLFIKEGMILRGDRICQFRIQLSQKATLWDKLRWLFSSKIEFVEVKNLEENDRGGFGSTGVR